MTSILISLACCLIVTLTVVASLYIWPYKDRNDPRAIRLKMVSAVISTVPAILIASYVVPMDKYPDDLYNILGLSWSKNCQIQNSVLPVLLLSGNLFAGPIDVVRYTFTREELINEILDSVKSLPFWRDYLIAPVTEELIFRASIIAILSSSISNSFIVLILSSIFFALAHFHHYLFQSTSKIRVTFREAMSIQIISCIFGIYSGALFMKSNCLLSSILCHIFCNAMGAPDFELLRSREVWWRRTVRGALIFLVCFPAYLIFYWIEAKGFITSHLIYEKIVTKSPRMMKKRRETIDLLRGKVCNERCWMKKKKEKHTVKRINYDSQHAWFNHHANLVNRIHWPLWLYLAVSLVNHWNMLAIEIRQ